MSESLTRQRSEEMVLQARPACQSIVWLDGGDNRDIAVVDGREAFRFPKDEAGIDVCRYEFEVLKLLQGKLSVEIPEPIELAGDGSYNVQSFLPGKVLSKHAVTLLPFEERHDLGLAIAGALGELNKAVTRDELLAIAADRPLTRSRDDHYAAIYESATQQDSKPAAAYRENYERMQTLRPNGSASNIIVFGDFSSPNLVLSDDNRLKGLIDWTELGFGDIHNELRPVFSVLGAEAFEDTLQVLEPVFGPINAELIQLSAVVHELGVLVAGKQKGTLTPERTKLAAESLNVWLGEGWDS